ncbi:hypothetical protein BGZ83_004005, partial [Gryganskiella cystojenkinii]
SRFTGRIGTHILDERPSHKTGKQASHGKTNLSGHANAVPAIHKDKIPHRHYEQDPTDHHNHHRHQCDEEFCSDHDESHIHEGSKPRSKTSRSLPAKDDFRGYVFDASKVHHRIPSVSHSSHPYQHSDHSLSYRGGGYKAPHLNYLPDDYVEKTREPAFSIGQLPRQSKWSGPVEYLEDETGGVAFGAVTSKTRSARHTPVYHAG